MGLIELAIAALCINATCTDYDGFGSSSDDNSLFDAEFVSQKKARLLKLEEEIANEIFSVTTMQNENLSGTTKINNTLVGTGVAFDLFNILQRKFKFNYTIISPEANVFGTRKSGVLNLLKENKVSLAVAFLPVITNYSQAVRYSPSLDTGEWVVLMNRPKESATGSGLLAPFTLPVWMLILLSLLVVGPVIYFIIWIQTKLCRDDKNPLFPLPACIWFVYGALLKQGTTLNPITDSSRILFATWWIFITILTAFYTANLTAFLTLSKFTLPISKPEDIGAKKSRWSSTGGNALEDALGLKTETYYDLDKALDTFHLGSFIDKSDSFILDDSVKKKKMMFIREKPIVEYVMYNDYKQKTKAGIEESLRCTYIITDFKVASFERAFAYNLDFKYQELFDNAIQYLVESGIVQYKLRELLPDTQICPHNLGNKERQLQNSDLLMTYMIVGAGFIISAIVFTVEMVVQRLKKTDAKPNGKHQMRRQGLMPMIEQAVNNKTKNNNLFEVNLNNNFTKNTGFESNFVTPPPPYHSLFNPSLHNQNVKRRNINGREYWVYDSDGQIRLVPTRTPSALLFQFTH